MFCHKCGIQIPVDAGFCHKCGAKIVNGETPPQSQDTPVQAVVSESVKPSPQATAATVQVTSGNGTGFKEYVDNHVRSTTKFQSAEDLLKNAKPLRFVWWCFVIPAILGLIAGGLLGLLIFGGVLGLIAMRITSIILEIRCVSKTFGKFNGSIDTDKLIPFLSVHLPYISPQFHEWSYIKRTGYGVRGAITTAITNSASEALKEVTLCAPFGKKQNRLTTILVRPNPADRDSGQMEYILGAEKNGISWGIGCEKYICMFKTAPILQAAMEYYLNQKSK